MGTPGLMDAGKAEMSAGGLEIGKWLREACKSSTSDIGYRL